MQDEKPRLGRDVLFALAAVGWADGQLDQEEANAIVRTALEEGISFEEIAEIEEATKHPVDLGVIDRKNLSKADRLFVYAVAVWMTRLDGKTTEAEASILVRLGDALRIPPVLRDYADQIARQVQTLPTGDRPEKYDLSALRRVIGERLALAQDRLELQLQNTPSSRIEYYEIDDFRCATGPAYAKGFYCQKKLCFVATDLDYLVVEIEKLLSREDCFWGKYSTIARDGMYLGRIFLTKPSAVGTVWKEFKQNAKLFCSIQDDDFTSLFRQ